MFIHIYIYTWVQLYICLCTSMCKCIHIHVWGIRIETILLCVILNQQSPTLIWASQNTIETITVIYIIIAIISATMILKNWQNFRSVWSICLDNWAATPNPVINFRLNITSISKNYIATIIINEANTTVYLYCISFLFYVFFFFGGGIHFL